MNIIEQEAKKFFESGFISKKIRNDLTTIKSSLESKLYDFNRQRDKLDFLKILRLEAINDKEQHMKTCSGCGYDKTIDLSLFIIDQEVEDINNSYSFTPQDNDKFSIEEESELHEKLNTIIDKLEKQGIGQKIIFEEIEDLKNHFNLGKKNWFQLLKGKVVDLTIKKVLNKTIVEAIYNDLSYGFEEAMKFIDKS